MVESAQPAARWSVVAVVGFALALLALGFLALLEPWKPGFAATGLGAAMAALPGLLLSIIGAARCRGSRGALRGGELALVGAMMSAAVTVIGFVGFVSCVNTVWRKTLGAYH